MHTILKMTKLHSLRHGRVCIYVYIWPGPVCCPEVYRDVPGKFHHDDDYDDDYDDDDGDDDDDDGD